MIVIVWAASKGAGISWIFSWELESSGSDSFEVWFEGELLDTVTTGEYTFNLPGWETEPPSLEIFETGATAENGTYPPYALLQWYGDSDAAAYIVEQYVSGAWNTERTISETGAGYYAIKTPVLDDCTEANWRVCAIDLYGNRSATLAFDLEMVRNPDAPAVTISVGDPSSDGYAQITVEEA